jgi:aromatic ring hydroxylase
MQLTSRPGNCVRTSINKAGSGDYEELERLKLVKPLRNPIGGEFGGRHELFKRNYAGN